MEVKEILKNIIEGLVDDRDAIEIEEVQSSTMFVYEIKVGTDDIGKVIGKSGRNATAIRTIITSIARKQGKSAHIKFNDRAER